MKLDAFFLMWCSNAPYDNIEFKFITCVFKKNNEFNVTGCGEVSVNGDSIGD